MGQWGGNFFSVCVYTSEMVQIHIARQYDIHQINTIVQEADVLTITWESVTLNTRFQGRRNAEASPKTRVETYTSF